MTESEEFAAQIGKKLKEISETENINNGIDEILHNGGTDTDIDGTAEQSE